MVNAEDISPDTPQSGLLVETADDEIHAQADYLSQTYGTSLEVRTFRDLASLTGSLVVPYINIPETASYFASHGIDTWGIDPKMVHVLKNKAQAHELFSKISKPGFEVPDHITGDVRTLQGFGHHYFHQNLRQYTDTAMTDYQPGLMIRAAESDGGYGSCRLETDYNHSSPYQVFNDGDAKPTANYQNLKDALAHSQDYLLSSANSKTDIEPRVVVSRLMDIADSPGLSVAVSNGEVVSLGWNGQVKEGGSSACTGTSSYKADSPYLSEAQSQFEHSTASHFTDLLKQTAENEGVNFDQVTGFANIDLMIPGPKELEFRKRLGLTPETVYLAEVNPRLTNYTDAILAMLWTTRGSDRITIGKMLNSIDQGILTIDKYPISKGTDMNAFRQSVTRLDQQLKPLGARILLRMPDQPQAGFILSGDTSLARQALNNLSAKAA